MFGAGTLRTASQSDVTVGDGTRIEDNLPTKDISRQGDGDAIGGNLPTEGDVPMGDSGAVGGNRPVEDDASMGGAGAMGSNRRMEDDALMGDGGGTEGNHPTGNDASTGDGDSMGGTRPTDVDAPVGGGGVMEDNRYIRNDTSMGDGGSNGGNRPTDAGTPMGIGSAVGGSHRNKDDARMGDGGGTGGNHPTEVDTPTGGDMGGATQDDSTEGDCHHYCHVLRNLKNVTLILCVTLSDSGVDSDDSLPTRPRKRLRLHTAEQTEKDSTMSDEHLRSNKSPRYGATIPHIRSNIHVSTPHSSLTESSSPSNEPSTPLVADNSASVVTPLRATLSKSLKSLISLKRRSVSSRKNSTRKKISGVPRKRSFLFFGKKKSIKGHVRQVIVVDSKASSPKLPVSPPSPRLDEDGLEIIAPTLYTLNVFNRRKKKLNVRPLVVFLLPFFFPFNFFFFKLSLLALSPSRLSVSNGWIAKPFV